MTFNHYFFLIAALLGGSLSGHALPKDKSVRTNKPLTMLVGTYTEGSNSKGVYAYRFDQNKGTANYLSCTSIGNPSYIIAAGGNKFAYSVSEYNNGKATANAFKLDKTTGKLVLLNSQFTTDSVVGGEDPCFIMTNGKQVVTANYTGGDMSVFPVGKDGSLLPLAHRFVFKGSAPGLVAHIHCVRLTPDGKYLLATDLGNDRIYRFDVDNRADYRNGKPYLTHCKVIYQGTRGMGPRHFIFSDNGRYAYLIHELGGIVIVFSYNDGNLKPIQTVMADQGGGHGSADIHISPDGRFLYTSHRLKSDGVAIFRINRSNGLITKIGYQLTGIHPRNFNITPNGKFLLVACRDSNMIQVYKRNLKTGLLTDTQHRISLGKPVCIQFLKP